MSNVEEVSLGANADDHPATANQATTPNSKPPLLGVHRFVMRFCDSATDVRFQQTGPKEGHWVRTKDWKEYTGERTKMSSQWGDIEWHWITRLNNFRDDQSQSRILNYNLRAYEIDRATLLSVADYNDKDITACIDRCVRDGILVPESLDHEEGWIVNNKWSGGEIHFRSGGSSRKIDVMKTIQLKAGINSV